MPTFGITIPIAGHAYIEVEAENEQEAEYKAFENLTVDNLTEWEGLRTFIEGNVCHCPVPWNIDVELIDDDE